MRRTSCVRLAVIGLAAGLTAASATSGPKKGPTRTAHEGVVYETRPSFTWEALPGARYKVVLYAVPRDPTLPRQVVLEQRGISEGAWTATDDLAWGTRYELYLHYDGNTQVLTSWGFTIGFAAPSIVSPTPAEPPRTLSPELRIAALAHPDVVFAIELAEDPGFREVVDQAVLVQGEAAVADPGPDGQPDTADDERHVPWRPGPILQADRTYHWRLRAHHFRRGALAGGAAPDLTRAAGASEATGTLVIAPQAGPDPLLELTWLVNDPAGAAMPAINKKLDLAYVAGGATIRVAPAPAKAKVPGYGAEREELTEAVRGSADLRPAWDAEGKALMFDSDRAQGVRNVWLKRRDSTAYTQVTFAERAATRASFTRDGRRIVYQVGGAGDGAPASIWIADRDGRNAVELGAGEDPALSADGAWLAFAAPGDGGARSIWRMDLAGEQREQLTRGGDDRQPVWRPDGRSIVFVSDRAGNDDLWMLELGTEEPQPLTTYLGVDTDPEITPDGRYVLFASQRGGGVMGVWMGELPTPPAPPPPPPKRR